MPLPGRRGLAIASCRLYIWRMMPRSMIAAATLAIASPGAGPALAKDAAKPPALPGVETGYSIVKPMPEPDAMTDPGTGGAHFKVGDTEVRISGSIMVDISAGPIGAPRH